MLLSVLSRVARIGVRPSQMQLKRTAHELPYVQLCGAMKSGTSLLQALFDGSPGALVYPHESELPGRHFHRLNEASQSEALRLLEILHRYYLSRHHPDGKRHVPLTKLAVILARQRAMMSLATDFWTRHASFAISFAPGPHATWIDKSPLAFLHADYIQQRPRTKIIQIVRNPADTFSSIYVKAARRGYDPCLSGCVPRIPPAVPMQSIRLSPTAACGIVLVIGRWSA